MQTILGSGGVVGTQLAHELSKYSEDITLVSRSPIRVNKTDHVKIANLLNTEQTLNAVEGSDVVYLTVGLPYKSRVWEEQWPIIMKNVIDACARHSCKLVFFDNVYLYGKVKGWMTEKTPVNPCSRKGLVRAKLARMLMDAVEKGRIDALIARSADFYGPDTPLSIINSMVLENMIKGKKAQLLGGEQFKHSFGYTPDQSVATALLGNTPEAYNQVWHLPTDKNVLSGHEIVQICAENLGNITDVKYQIIDAWLLRFLGVFNSDAREIVEMLYQFNQDYLFDSSKFDGEFDFNTTPYATGLKNTIAYYFTLFDS